MHQLRCNVQCTISCLQAWLLLCSHVFDACRGRSAATSGTGANMQQAWLASCGQLKEQPTLSS